LRVCRPGGELIGSPSLRVNTDPESTHDVPAGWAVRRAAHPVPLVSWRPVTAGSRRPG
jgi:hypothetical protein